MALISAKNLVTPLTNKIHLTTIILIVVAFAFLRLSGGKLSLESSKKSGKEKTSSFAAPEKPKGSNPAGSIRDNSALPWEKKSAAPAPAENPGKAKSLDDIEKLFRK